jgi:chitosanase
MNRRTESCFFFRFYSGANPETIGEASILMGQTCFPNAGIDGGTGHDQADVGCKSAHPLASQQMSTFFVDRHSSIDIIFGTQVPSGVGDETIDISALKQLGDAQAQNLIKTLGI